jgi:hypothetical protein
LRTTDIGRYLSDTFSIQNCLKRGYSLSPLLFKFALENASSNIKGNKKGLGLDGTHQLLVYIASVNLLGNNINVRK